MDEELLSLLSHELGQILDWKELCPGVYYFGVRPHPDSEHPCREYYLVLDNAPISQEARALGRSLDGVPGLLYAIDPPRDGAWTTILYELCKNEITHGISVNAGWALEDTALAGMDLCPAYFGAYPVPLCTPWGWTLRWRALENGVYWIETNQCRRVLAVCNPIWTGELSEGVQKAGIKQVCGKDSNKDLGYLFFEEKASCVAIFELLEVRPKWFSTGLIRKAELMNAIWKYQPMYAATYNAEEQAGLHDSLGILLQLLGEDNELQGSPEHMISLGQETGTDFIGFWK